MVLVLVVSFFFFPQPYIDIWTYVAQGPTKIRVRQHKAKGHTWDYDKSLLLQTKQATFIFQDSDYQNQILKLPIPLKSGKYLNVQFGVSWRDICKVGFWNHQKEVARPLNHGWKKEMPCAKLMSLHPEWKFSDSRLKCPS